MSESSVGNYKGKNEEKPNDEWVNPTSKDNIILENYVKKCLSDDPVWYKMGYPLSHKLDEMNILTPLKKSHKEMKEIHYSLNNNFKLLCSMVEPLAKAAAQRRRK
uniref:Uncharacterized protein n=1 Tax=Tanacetum cinerariifolium TaxID=118510 RepID=A0A6L2J557_TANCI|nr:hypothetical protein [Tanacetum cinerariifolium]